MKEGKLIQQEIDRRLDLLDRNEVSFFSWEEVKKHLNKIRNDKNHSRIRG